LLEISKAMPPASTLKTFSADRNRHANLMDSKICLFFGFLDEKDQKLKLKATHSISEEYLKSEVSP